MRGTSDFDLCYQEIIGLDRVLDIGGFVMKIGLDTWIKEYIQVGMCLNYLEEKSVGWESDLNLKLLEIYLQGIQFRDKHI